MSAASCEHCGKFRGYYWYQPPGQPERERVCWRCLPALCDAFGYSPRQFGMSREQERISRKRRAARDAAVLAGRVLPASEIGREYGHRRCLGFRRVRR